MLHLDSSLFTNHLLLSFKWAVSSVVEHLVYTERVGGSKPSPPSLIFQWRTCDPVAANSALRIPLVVTASLFPSPKSNENQNVRCDDKRHQKRREKTEWKFPQRVH